MADFDLISSIMMSAWNIDEVADEDELRQESMPLSSLHMPPRQDNRVESDEGESDEGESYGDESDEEWISEEAEDFGDSSEYLESYEILDMDYEYAYDEEFLEESCLRLIISLGHSLIPTAQFMMTTARSRIPTLPAMEYLHSVVDSEDDNSDPEEGENWSIIDQQ
ncbi:hypothetical protein GGI43DRAFT_408174 [Trichoderma evansii]